MSASVHSKFVAARRHRPDVKIVLSNTPAGISSGKFGTRVISINRFTPQLDQVISDQMTEVMCGFLDGRYSIKNMTNGEFVYLDLGDAFVDCTPNDQGEASRFDCLGEFVSDSFISDLASRLMATFKVRVSIVEDRELSLVIRHDTAE